MRLTEYCCGAASDPITRLVKQNPYVPGGLPWSQAYCHLHRLTGRWFSCFRGPRYPGPSPVPASARCTSRVPFSRRPQLPIRPFPLSRSIPPPGSPWPPLPPPAPASLCSRGYAGSSRSRGRSRGPAPRPSTAARSRTRSSSASSARPPCATTETGPSCPPPTRRPSTTSSTTPATAAGTARRSGARSSASPTSSATWLPSSSTPSRTSPSHTSTPPSRRMTTPSAADTRSEQG